VTFCVEINDRIEQDKNMNPALPLDSSMRIDPVHFGTDGWRAIIGDDFNPMTVTRVADAAARIFAQERTTTTNTLVVGYDCRENAGRYAVLVATVLAAQGFEVLISDRYCPTPTLCWTIAHTPQALGGLMLTSSHNPAEYLGIKLRMSDGGASPASFTDKVEAALLTELPACFDEALANFEAAQNGTPEKPATPLEQAPHLQFADLMSAYLAALKTMVDGALIKAAGLRIVLDPMFGAGRGYLAQTLRSLGVEVVEVNGIADTSFNGLHPEPIMPWVEVGAAKVAELAYDACFVTDGDADRIGAVDDTGTYVTSHRVFSLIIGHLAENHQQTGRVVRTQAGSNLLRRQCDRFSLALTTRPIGFKWIYEEMLKGDVLIGGEESGGIGMPTHVRERDGLLMALLLAELMATSGKKLSELVEELLATLGTLEYARRDLRLTPEQKERFLVEHVKIAGEDSAPYLDRFAPLGETLDDIDRIDGIKFNFASDAWLLVRPSGTEPLVRVYAEAASMPQVEALLDIGCTLAQG
jgi:phosphomannomutase